MKKKDRNIIQDIQDRAMAKYYDKLFVEKPKSPVVNEIIDRGLKDEDVSPEQKERLQNIRDTGMFDGMERVENPETVEKIDQFVEAEIKKAIDDGHLTHPSKYYEKKSKQLRNRNIKDQK